MQTSLTTPPPCKIRRVVSTREFRVPTETPSFEQQTRSPLVSSEPIFSDMMPGFDFLFPPSEFPTSASEESFLQFDSSLTPSSNVVPSTHENSQHNFVAPTSNPFSRDLTTQCSSPEEEDTNVFLTTTTTPFTNHPHPSRRFEIRPQQQQQHQQHQQHQQQQPEKTANDISSKMMKREEPEANRVSSLEMPPQNSQPTFGAFHSQFRAGSIPVCLRCGTSKTPRWRTGPQGKRTLCNSCGLKYQGEARKRQFNYLMSICLKHNESPFPPDGWESSSP